MAREWIILITLVVYKLVLVWIGLWASRRTQDSSDFFIGGKQLGPWVAAVSASASASSAWSLLGVSGAAFTMGLSAIWIFPAVVLGYIFNWYWLAPRVRRYANQQEAITLSEVVAGKDQWRKAILGFASFAIVFSFAFYIAAQFQAAGSTFAANFDVSITEAIVTGAVIILVYTLLGGFWAVSVTDTLQGLLMAAIAFLLPILAVTQAGGPSVIYQSLISNGGELYGNFAGASAIGFVVGMLGIGLGNPGQPHVVNRFMALRDDKALKSAARIGVAWPVIVFAGMLTVGWCARVLIPTDANAEQVMLALTEMLFHPVVAGIIVAAVLSAIMSTADSQLLVSAACLAQDLQLAKGRNALTLSRLAVVAMCVLALVIALFAPEAIFSRVLFAWAAIGSAFAPVLIWLVAGYQIDGRYRLAAMMLGFGLTIVFNWQANAPGDVLERVLPFVVALVVARIGAVKRAEKGSGAEVSAPR
ncbi:sodium/proline symporter [Paraferrimonas sedimenticola]|uniref:Sodium/proline symporter n=1 Tax=Paraferrimonas sedimenticola TaxID=375674 RepID=A0AA37RW51_9GAMM|nr:sodium/proline symporter [Paraferrimonas sedimenticola]GLP96321.1 sodium:proline symporter [Paraferrimonas sedimenticola]